MNAFSCIYGYFYPLSFWGNFKTLGKEQAQKNLNEFFKETRLDAMFANPSLEYYINSKLLADGSIQLVSDGDSVGSQQVIQAFARKALRFPSSAAGDLLSSSPTLHKHELFSSLLESLLRAQKNLEECEPGKGYRGKLHDEARQERIHMALHALEKFHPGLKSCNDWITTLLHPTESRKRGAAKAGLEMLKGFKPDPYIREFPIAKHAVGSDGSQEIGKAEDSPRLREVADPFWKSRQIVMGRIGGCMGFFGNLKEVAVIEKLPTPILYGPEWLRDSLFVLGDDKYLIPPRTLVEKDGMRLSSRFKKLISDLLNVSEPTFQGSTGRNLLQDYGYCEKTLFYFEGGNLLSATNKKGEKVCLSGASNILSTILISKLFFSSPEKMEELITKTGELLKSSEPPVEHINIAKERLSQAGLISELEESDQQKIATLTVASIAMIRSEMESTLKCPVIHLGGVFEEQPAFHLDMFLLPAPGGQVYLQDYSKSIELLGRILNSNQLAPEDLSVVRRYLENATGKQERFGAQLDAIATDLNGSGFDVIRVAGSYSGDKCPPVNFLNSIVGIGESGRYCMTNGASGLLGKILADDFTETLSRNGFSSVYFLGRETRVPLLGGMGRKACEMTYDIAKKSLQYGGGIHCRTQTLSTPVEKFDPGPLQRSYYRESDYSYVGDSLREFHANVLLKME